MHLRNAGYEAQEWGTGCRCQWEGLQVPVGGVAGASGTRVAANSSESSKSRVAQKAGATRNYPSKKGCERRNGLAIPSWPSSPFRCSPGPTERRNAWRLGAASRRSFRIFNKLQQLNVSKTFRKRFKNVSKTFPKTFPKTFRRFSKRQWSKRAVKRIAFRRSPPFLDERQCGGLGGVASF